MIKNDQYEPKQLLEWVRPYRYMTLFYQKGNKIDNKLLTET